MWRSLTRTTLLVAFASAASPAFAEDPAEPLPADQLNEVQQRLAEDRAAAAALAEQEAAIATEIAGLTQQLVEMAGRAQDLESELSSIEDTLAAYNRELVTQEQRLGAEHDRLAATLAGLVRIALQPPEAALARPGSALDLVRSAMLLRIAVPEIERRAAKVQQDLAQLQLLRDEIARESETERQKAAALAAERGQLQALLERKQALADTTAAERAGAETRAQELASQAQDLKSLIDELERQAVTERLQAEAKAKAKAEAEARAKAEAKAQAEAKAKAQAEAQAQAEADAKAKAAAAAQAEVETQAEPAAKTEIGPVTEADATPVSPPPTQQASLGTEPRDFPAKPGGLTLPARGSLAAAYGDPLPDSGEESRGLVIRTRAQAQIVAPYDGQVVYAGPFRRYGLILIIEHAGRYHSLLAGFDRIDVAVGQVVVAGEPVGVMGDTADATQGRNAGPELYVELRHNGQPIDPMPWFATQLTKGEG